MAKNKFDELEFFAQVKKRPGMFLGSTSLLSLKDYLCGMGYAFSFYDEENQFKYFDSFVKWYHDTIIKDKNGYACWWNYILYISGGNDTQAFSSFFRCFEDYLIQMHNTKLPELD